MTSNAYTLIIWLKSFDIWASPIVGIVLYSFVYICIKNNLYGCSNGEKLKIYS